MKLIVKFVLSKGDGEMPDLGLLSANKLNKEYLLSCLEFMPAFEEVEDLIESWKLIDNGLNTIDFTNGKLIGYPNPVVEFVLDKGKYDARIEDKADFLRAVWESSYKFSIPGVNEEDPFFFCDFNGYTHFI